MLFRRLPGDRHEILIRDRKGPDLVLPEAPTGPTLPHDLVHAAVESALGLHDGFWGAVAQGAVFQGMEFAEPRRHRRAGLKVLRRKGEAVMAAELKVNWAYRAWSGLPTTGRGVGRSPLTDDELARACAALDRAAERWERVPEGQALTWRW